MWADYWNGHSWTQTQLDSTAVMSSSLSGSALYTTYVLLFLNSSGQCAVESYRSSSWGHLPLGDGGIPANQLGTLSLTGGLSYQSFSNLIFARRSDGNAVIFYYQ
jgi:hypothetical protein